MFVSYTCTNFLIVTCYLLPRVIFDFLCLLLLCFILRITFDFFSKSLPVSENFTTFALKQSIKACDDILDFHQRFESIHPFQARNGRVGRLVMFKECLANSIVPFIITEELCRFYYRGLQQWPNIPEFLRDTCLTAQDNFKAIMK